MRAILTYHSIDGSGSPISVTPEIFEEHAQWLGSGAVRVVALGRLLDPDLAEPAVAITFDDGFSNVADSVGRLTDRGLPVTIFVVTDHVGGRNSWGGRSAPGIPTLPLLGWHELGRLAERGIEMGAHTRTHPKMSGLSRDQVIAELDEPVATMRRELGRAPISFAYPYGATSELAKELAGARYQHCCTTEFRLLGRREDRRALPRLDMYYWRDRGAIRQLGDSRLQTKVWVRRQARAVKALFDQ